MVTIDYNLYAFFQCFEIELSRHELLQVCRLKGNQLKAWKDAQIAKCIYKQEQADKMDFINDDTVAKGMFRAYQKGGLDAVHQYIDKSRAMIEYFDLIEHTYERYLNLRDYAGR